MKILFASALAVFALAAASFAASATGLLQIGGVAVGDGPASSDSRPPGVLPSNWIALGENAGFLVVTESESDGMPSLEGHLFAKHEGFWKRLDSEGGFRTIPSRQGVDSNIAPAAKRALND